MAVFVIGILGSPHCGLMCSAFLPRGLGPSLQFQMGRFLGYLVQWSLVRGFGQLLVEFMPGVSLVYQTYAFFLILLLYFMSFQAARGRKFQGPKVHFSPQSSVIARGLVLAFRGCSWFWAFLIGTAAQQSFLLSLLMLVAFWLSNFVGLYSGGWVLARIGSGTRRQAWGLFFMATLQLSLWMHWLQVPAWSVQSGFSKSWVGGSTPSVLDKGLEKLQMICH